MEHLNHNDHGVTSISPESKPSSPPPPCNRHRHDVPRARSYSPIRGAKPAQSLGLGRKSRVPEKVSNPTMQDFCVDNGEGPSAEREKDRSKGKGLKAYVVDEAEELARSIGQNRNVGDGFAGPSKATPLIVESAKLERTPTPFPFTKTNRKGKDPMRISPTEKKDKFNTAPARLEPISLPTMFAISSPSPRPSSVRLGLEKGTVVNFPSQEEIDSWRVELDASTTSRHPGFVTPGRPYRRFRDSPLNNFKSPKELWIRNIDSVVAPSISSCPAPFPLAPTELRYRDFYSPLVGRSPLNEESLGIASPVSTERFYGMPDYRGDMDSPGPPPRKMRLKRRASSVSETRKALPPKKPLEMAEMDRDRNESTENGEDRENGQGLTGRLKLLFKKLWNKEADDKGEVLARRKGAATKMLKSRIAKSGHSINRIIGRVRNG
ncbi:hypothetical protein SLS60_010853 [Paraconiothyrium brasiliense]|uniref:Uncharacterized protein n=1 Tax=Paraconiothyrium brasiliense TaxID=300254 RepID=A0ABR3QM63_9PLEO